VAGVSSVTASSHTRSFQALGPQVATRRFTEAKSSLAGLALETGGQSFLDGVGPSKIARAIRADLECVYLISFDAAGLPEDRGLPLSLRVDDSRLKVRSRTRVVVWSDSARLASRLTSAFSALGSPVAEERLEAVVIPTGFREGRYTALVQVLVPGGKGVGSGWDVGLSALSRGRPGSQDSARVSVAAPGLPVVFEAEMEFGPGPYEVTAVAHELSTDRILSGRVEGQWPDPEEDRATVGPIALLQPAEAIFVRGAENRASGPLARTRDDLVRPDLPTALLAIVCRDRPRKLALEVDRLLRGETAVGFPPLAVEAGAERCFLISDLIPPGVMTEGVFVYSVRVLGLEGELAGAERSFAALLPTEVPSSDESNTPR
jgi:hypothetical protein